MKSLAKKKMVNHVAFLLDASGSMFSLTNAVRETFAKLVDGLATEEKKTGIETRIHIYSFGNSLKCHVSNGTPDMAGGYKYENRNEGTALINSTLELVENLEKYEKTKDDVSFLVYVLTDGAETEATSKGNVLRKALEALSDDWTMAILVPNSHGATTAAAYGFPEGNIQVWETTAKGLDYAGGQMIGATQSYYAARTLGTKSTKTLFTFPATLNKTEVAKKLEEVNPGDYQTLLVRKYDDGKAIKDFVESWTKEPYRVGSAYYQVTKPEKIQVLTPGSFLDSQPTR